MSMIARTRSALKTAYTNSALNFQRRHGSGGVNAWEAPTDPASWKVLCLLFPAHRPSLAQHVTRRIWLITWAICHELLYLVDIMWVHSVKWPSLLLRCCRA